MSNDRAGAKRSRRRGGSLRKHQTLDNVVVEEGFSLQQDSDKVGEGVYVSATASNNKRYYGVLVDQAALKAASTIYFEDQADSLELNRRIKVLLQKKQEKVVSNGSAKPSNGSSGVAPSVGAVSPVDTGKLDHATDRKLPIPNPPSNAAFGSSVVSAEATLAQGGDHSDNISSTSTGESAKRPLPATTLPHDNGGDVKKTKMDTEIDDRAVQKFKYVWDTVESGSDGKSNDPGYRVLVATFCNIAEASCGNPSKAKAIRQACEEGGNCILDGDPYYYQFQVLPSSLVSEQIAKHGIGDLRTSMGFHSFLHTTELPAWFPLSNLTSASNRVLSMLNLKMNKGKIKYDETSLDGVLGVEATAESLSGGTKLPMHDRVRHQYQIGIIGGGIAGLSCCQELVSKFESEGIDVKVTLMEARDRLGGRLWTDRSFSDEAAVELGASWIHGIDDNPLAVLAKQAKVDFVTASEEVQMLGKGLRRVDQKLDDRMGSLFDDILDHAADNCWGSPEDTSTTRNSSNQRAVRWYSSVFLDDENSKDEPELKGTPSHRSSSDRSIDVEMAKAITQHKLKEVSRLNAEDQRMLLWNTKNIEYALGANISDLSMKYWDSDEKHAFGGDHVLLKQGYSTVIEHMKKKLVEAGAEKFECILNYPVGKVEYSRKSSSKHFRRDRFGRERKLVDLSDTCSVTKQDSSETKYFDFLVCAAPLGVLKECVERSGDATNNNKLTFNPSLPFGKIDAITNVGFGLLDKVYIRFPAAFWRGSDLFQKDDQCLFGNVSGVNPHHYMFFDVGRCLGSSEKSAPLLMSLVSGREAVACEKLTDEALRDEILETLKAIFSPSSVPEPSGFRRTQWGKDRFARGSYTFLPPGATDQDFQLLQSPVNGNGDSLLLDSSETMRLFFAGEHTTALHPSMAHGALLSGLRAAQEVATTILHKSGGTSDKDIDRVIPVPLFRHRNASTGLNCGLCQKVGGQVREGSLIAFKRGTRQILVHNNCAEYSPEVEVAEGGKWKNVVKALNRGKLLTCFSCSQSGATMGCTAKDCFRVFHFSCAEDTGWRFDRDGKVFYCEAHRRHLPVAPNQCDRVSMSYMKKKLGTAEPTCFFCGYSDETPSSGMMLAFQAGSRRGCAHENCIRYSNNVDTSEIEESRMGHEYQNVFLAADKSKNCSTCGRPGATIECTDVSCFKVFHLGCAQNSGWNFERRGRKFRCGDHKSTKKSTAVVEESGIRAQDATSVSAPAFLQHTLLAQFGAIPVAPKTDNDVAASPKKKTVTDVAVNDDIGGTAAPQNAASPMSIDAESTASVHSHSSYDTEDETNDKIKEVIELPLKSGTRGTVVLVEVKRASETEGWGMRLQVRQQEQHHVLAVVHVAGSLKSPPGQEEPPRLKTGDLIASINDIQIGSDDLHNLRGVLSWLKTKTTLAVEVRRT